MALMTALTQEQWPTQSGGVSDELPIMFSRPILSFAAAVTGVIMVAGIIGNALTILAFCKTQRANNVTTVFIVCLCAADLLFCMTVLPFNLVRFTGGAGSLKEEGIACKLLPFLQYGNVGVSLLFIAMITINRYVMITHYAAYTKIYRTPIIVSMILFCWLFSFGMQIPTLLGKWGTYAYDSRLLSCTIMKDSNGRSAKSALFFVGFVIPCLVIIFCYTRIYMVVRSSDSRMRRHAATNTKLSRKGKEQKEVKLKRNEWRITKMVLAIFLSFLVCYLPITIVKIADSKIQYPSYHILTYLLLYLSACINPIIYVIMNKQYRQAYKALLTCHRLQILSFQGRNTSLAEYKDKLVKKLSFGWTKNQFWQSITSTGLQYKKLHLKNLEAGQKIENSTKKYSAPGQKQRTKLQLGMPKSDTELARQHAMVMTPGPEMSMGTLNVAGFGASDVGIERRNLERKIDESEHSSVRKEKRCEFWHGCNTDFEIMKGIYGGLYGCGWIDPENGSETYETGLNMETARRRMATNETVVASEEKDADFEGRQVCKHERSAPFESEFFGLHQISGLNRSAVPKDEFQDDCSREKFDDQSEEPVNWRGFKDYCGYTGEALDAEKWKPCDWQSCGDHHLSQETESLFQSIEEATDWQGFGYYPNLEILHDDDEFDVEYGYHPNLEISHDDDEFDVEYGYHPNLEISHDDDEFDAEYGYHPNLEISHDDDEFDSGEPLFNCECFGHYHVTPEVMHDVCYHGNTESSEIGIPQSVSENLEYLHSVPGAVRMQGCSNLLTFEAHGRPQVMSSGGLSDDARIAGGGMNEHEQTETKSERPIAGAGVLEFMEKPTVAHEFPSEDLNVMMHSLMFKFQNLPGAAATNVEAFLLFCADRMTPRICREMEKETRDQGETSLWFKLKFGRVTASNLHAVANCRTPSGYLTKSIVGLSSFSGNEATMRGHRIEKQVTELVARRVKMTFKRCGLFLSGAYPILGASPDAINDTHVLEIKSPYSEKSHKEYLTKDNKVAKRYLAQIQMQMFMTGRTKGLYCVAAPDFETSRHVDIVSVDFDKEFIEDLVVRATKFWKANIFPLLTPIKMSNDSISSLMWR